MCGIVGKVDGSLSHGQMLSDLSCMTDAIVHRGPDDAGHEAGPGMGIGMRRLSIIDVAGGQQPISNEAGDIFVVCNGEIYNHKELRQRLESKGHCFRTKSDAEVIVHLYEDYGEECFQHLRGMFGLAIWDSRNKRMLIARDRLGKKPLFYADCGDRLTFGSEMKSLLADDPSLRTPNYAVLGHFFQFAYIPEPDTIYSGIKRLPAGCYGVWDANGLRIAPYWQLQFEPDHTTSEQEWAELLDAKLEEAVKIRLESEVPLGVFLSGGLDSSAVVAYAHAAGLKPLNTFTVGFDRSEWDESQDAQRIADHFGTTHHRLHLSEQTLGSTFADTLQAVIAHCDEPFGDASAIPTYHISRLAREHVTVILSGDGGDELFAGYSSYRGALFAQAYRKWLPGWLGQRALPSAAQALASVLPGSAHFKALRVAKIFRDSSQPLMRSYRDKTSIWNLRQLGELFSPEMLHTADYLGDQYMPDALWNIMTDDTGHDFVSRLTETDIRSYMLDDILVKVDRMSMAHSLEVRSPLLDHEIVELAARMPTSVKIKSRYGLGEGKHILRKVLDHRLPQRSLRKGKQGFSVPLRDWFRGGLRDFVHDTLLDDKALPTELFQRNAIEKTLHEHNRGTVDHANRIWLLLTFATWYAQNSTGSSLPASQPVLAGEVS